MKKPGAILKLTVQQSAEEADFVLNFSGLVLWVCFHFRLLIFLLLLSVLDWLVKKGGKCALWPAKKCFAVAEFDVDEDFAIKHDLILWLGKVMNDQSSGKKHLFKGKFSQGKIRPWYRVGTNYGKKGASMRFVPKKRFPVA